LDCFDAAKICLLSMAVEGLAALGDLIVAAVELLMGVVELCFLFIELSVNLLEIALELLALLFGARWELKRVKFRRPQAKREPNLAGAVVLIVLMLSVSLGFVGYHTVLHRKVEVVLKDGSRVAFAKFVMDRKGKQLEVEAVDGELKLPRFGVEGLHVLDRRFVGKSWPGEHVPSTVVLERTERGEFMDALVKGVRKAVKAAQEQLQQAPE
jgi:hypothetical protein